MPTRDAGWLRGLLIALSSLILTLGVSGALRLPRREAEGRMSPMVSAHIAAGQADDQGSGRRIAYLPWLGRGPLCAGKVDANGRCSHGPDPAPPGYDTSRAVPLMPAAEVAQRRSARVTEPGLSLCVGDGVSGPRVQVVYAGLRGSPDRYADALPSIREWMFEMDAMVRDSAAATGGRRRVRFVHDGACNVVVGRVELSAASIDNLGVMSDEMQTQGYDREDRVYLAFVDIVDHICGVGYLRADDRPAANNASNYGRNYARVDRGCWSSFVAAHELFHNLGSVQREAPNYSGYGHCTDEYDVMCYEDGPGVVMREACQPSDIYQRLLDCHNDDYFSTAPPRDSYLDTHWNSADSVFLTADDGPPPEPDCPRTVSEVVDWRQVVLECDGHLWQPGIVPGEPCSEFEVTFIARESRDYVFNGPSTELWLDSDADGVPDVRVASRLSGQMIRLEAGAVYTARSFQPTPGFELRPVGP